MKRDRQQGFAVWLTGLPASGKSAVTAKLQELLAQRRVPFTVLESDAMRKLWPAPGYDSRDREYFYTSLVFIGLVLTQNGINVLFDATANRRGFRDRARAQIPNFVEVHVDTPLEICIQRDPKGLYRKALAGELQNVPGLQSDYEPPVQPELVVHGDRESPESAARRIAAFLESQGYLS